MRINDILSITEARKNIFDIAEATQKKGRHFMLTDKGRPAAVIMSAAQYESWAETLEVLSDFPNIEADIRSARNDLVKNKFMRLDEVRKSYDRKK